MTDEQMQKAMEFIAEQQAKFATDIQQLVEVHAAAEKRISRLESAVVTGITLVRELTEAQKETDAKLKQLAEQQSHTEERLEVVIAIVERYFSEKRNGEQ